MVELTVNGELDQPAGKVPPLNVKAVADVVALNEPLKATEGLVQPFTLTELGLAEMVADWLKPFTCVSNRLRDRNVLRIKLKFIFANF